MDFLANDLSLHGQFHDFRDFGDAVRRMMEIRQEIRRFGSSLYCCRSMAQARITAQVPMQQAVQGLSNEQRRALMQWLTQHGPHWEDVRLHIADDWIETGGEIVTDTAVGEAAFGRLNGVARDRLASRHQIGPSHRLRQSGGRRPTKVPTSPSPITGISLR